MGEVEELDRWIIGHIAIGVVISLVLIFIGIVTMELQMALVVIFVIMLHFKNYKVYDEVLWYIRFELPEILVGAMAVNAVYLIIKSITG